MNYRSNIPGGKEGMLLRRKLGSYLDLEIESSKPLEGSISCLNIVDRRLYQLIKPTVYLSNYTNVRKKAQRECRGHPH